VSERPRLSLVLCTVDRVDEVDRFLTSLAAQGVCDLEVLLVDQNEDGLLHPLIVSWCQRLPLRVLSSARGLSRARNVALSAVRGEVVAFPDDDCECPPGLLARVVQELDADPTLDGVSARSVDERGAGGGIRWARRPSTLRIVSVLGRHVSYGLFLRSALVQRTGRFDESLGVGAATPWGAGEETDFLMRAIALGGRVRYDPTLTVRHPSKEAADHEARRRRLEAYGRGMGRVLRRHMGVGRAAWWVTRPALAASWAMAQGHPEEAGERLMVSQARLRGWLDGPGGGPRA
jgi:glycosyltransferase involved in cell wall biosynthesis